jgi:hypothetical protein
VEIRDISFDLYDLSQRLKSLDFSFPPKLKCVPVLGNEDQLGKIWIAVFEGKTSKITASPYHRGFILYKDSTDKKTMISRHWSTRQAPDGEIEEFASQ